jgi:hypothetical protein
MKTMTVAGREALATLERLRVAYPNTGHYPVLLGDADEFDLLEEHLEEPFEPAEILAESRRIDPTQWFAKKAEEYAALYSDSAKLEGDGQIITADDMGIITHTNILTGEPLEEVTFALLPVKSAWEVFAQLNWGNWNDCPTPPLHCAVHRRWQEQWGAEVVSVTDSTVQCVVSRPPTNPEAALALALEQYLYCTDIVHQGVENLTNLASTLLNAKTWYFWWD